MKFKSWLKVWFLSVFIFNIILLIFIVYITNNGRPLRFTNSISYDAKLNFIRNSKILDNADTIVMGSSMGLNNLDGETLEKSMTINHVCNISAWSLKTSEVFELLDTINLDKIKTIVYPHQYFDFDKYKLMQINKNEIKSFLEGDFLFQSYLNTFYSLSKNFKNYISWEKRYLDDKKYSYLGFDKNGDINLTLSKDKIDKERWESYSKNFDIDKKNLELFIKMSKYFKEKNIKFIVVTTPHRLSLINDDEDLRNYLDFFSNKMEILAQKYNFIYINMHNKLMLDDSNFIDSSHLNLKGATVVANEVVNLLDKNLNK